MKMQSRKIITFSVFFLCSQQTDAVTAIGGNEQVCRNLSNFFLNTMNGFLFVVASDYFIEEKILKIPHQRRFPFTASLMGTCLALIMATGCLAAKYDCFAK